MVVLILANSAPGLLSFRQEVVQALLRNNCKVVVSVPNDSACKEIEQMGCNVIPTIIERHGKNPLKDIRLMRFYQQLIDKVSPNCVLTYTIKPNIYGGMAAVSRKVSYIVNITGLGTAVEHSGILQCITLLLYRFALRRVNCVFFQNEANRSFFAKYHIGIGKHRLIPGSGVNLSYFVPFPYPQENEPIRFNFISRLMKQKGIEEYFAVARYFRGQRDDVEFHVLGGCEENYIGELEQLQREGIIIYHGQQKDVRPFIGQSQCLIHPTYYPEGMSNVILESAASARPVIATCRPGCMEAVDDGVTGFLFPERDTEALIDCVKRFLALSNDERKRMGLAARRKMEREFDRQMVVDAYVDEITKIGKT